MTLIEIMVVISLIAALVALTAFGMGFIGRADVQGDALRLSGIIRYVYNAAATQNRTLQLVVDLDAGTLTVEELNVSGGLSLADLKGETLVTANDDADEEERAERLDEEDRGFGTVQRAGFSGPLLDEDDRRLTDGVFIIGVMTSHHEEMQTEGIATINFFPSGFVERSIIYVGDALAKESDDEGVVYSLLVQPLTGQTSIKPGRVPIRDSFFEAEEAD